MALAQFVSFNSIKSVRSRASISELPIPHVLSPTLYWYIKCAHMLHVLIYILLFVWKERVKKIQVSFVRGLIPCFRQRDMVWCSVVLYGVVGYITKRYGIR